MQGIRIGELLVEQGVLSDRQVDQILGAQKVTHRPFGELAERLFGISPRIIEDAWVEQYLRISGVVDLNDIEIDSNCLRVLSQRQAWQFHLLPLHHDDAELQIATCAQSLVRAVNFSTRAIDEPVYLLIAEREQLRQFLMQHYPVPQHIAEFSNSL